MGIYRCEVCDNLKDNDHDCGNDYKTGTACDACSELVICDTCRGRVEEGELNNDGECGACAYQTDQDAREAHADNEYTRRKENKLFGEEE